MQEEAERKIRIGAQKQTRAEEAVAAQEQAEGEVARVREEQRATSFELGSLRRTVRLSMEQVYRSLHRARARARAVGAGVGVDQPAAVGGVGAGPGAGAAAVNETTTRSSPPIDLIGSGYVRGGVGKTHWSNR